MNDHQTIRIDKGDAFVIKDCYFKSDAETRQSPIVQQAVSQSQPWRTTALLLTSFPFVIAARVLWQFYPGIWACVLFWAINLADEPLRWREMRTRRRMFYGLALAGAILNAVATLANAGVMPVLDLQEQKSIWVPANEHTNMIWLCDIFAGASLGDLFILAGIIGLIVNWSLEMANIIHPEPAVKGKRAPGLGL